MTEPNMIILYVTNPTASATFYQNLLGYAPIEASPTFVMFALKSGFMLGLWAKHTVEPVPTSANGASELVFAIENHQAVDQVSKEWKKRGLKIIQSPTTMDFGYTFVAVDLDGHRLRVFSPVQS
ncbi:MAG TPA: VOC family protein [Alphaproteobacteria bacterium]|nr:VOC family protein [Alphaproteobacteria bacterium]